MAFFKNLIFIALVVYAVAAEETKPADDGARVKKQAFIASVPAPVLAYSTSAPGAYSYGYSTYGAYPYAYSSAAYPAAAYPAAAYPAAAYPAPLPYAAKAYAAYPAYPAYANDDGSYYPGKYDKTYVPVAYPTAYHY